MIFIMLITIDLVCLFFQFELLLFTTEYFTVALRLNLCAPPSSSKLFVLDEFDN